MCFLCSNIVSDYSILNGNRFKSNRRICQKTRSMPNKAKTNDILCAFGFSFEIILHVSHMRHTVQIQSTIWSHRNSLNFIWIFFFEWTKKNISLKWKALEKHSENFNWLRITRLYLKRKIWEIWRPSDLPPHLQLKFRLAS